MYKYMLSLGIKQDLRMIISDFPFLDNNHKFWLSRSLRKESRFFQILFLFANENQKANKYQESRKNYDKKNLKKMDVETRQYQDFRNKDLEKEREKKTWHS